MIVGRGVGGLQYPCSSSKIRIIQKKWEDANMLYLHNYAAFLDTESGLYLFSCLKHVGLVLILVLQNDHSHLGRETMSVCLTMPSQGT